MEIPSSKIVSTKLERIAKLAREAPQMVFTSLAHHIDIDWLKVAYARTRKDGATGVDGQTAEEYAANLEVNLQSLLNRAKSGTYRAPPVRRVHIPKGTGSETRPIGIPTFEDKLLQRATAMLLDAVYEQDFLDCSYGFRTGRSAHQALEVLRNEAMAMHGAWVLEIDIRKYFDTIDHEHLRTILRQRVLDGVLLRLIGKWLNAGVMEDGELSFPDAGSPQGGVISPILANIFLHEVLDTWFENVVKPRLSGKASLVRFADDAVLLFANETDARKVMDTMAKRFAKYALTLHPVKTRLIDFRRPPRALQKCRGTGERPKTFDLLGFTHHWEVSRNGNWVIKRRTAKDRFRRSVKRIADWCREHLHDKVGAQQKALVVRLRGHYEYYGISGNFASLKRFRHEVRSMWRRWLDRRSHTARMSWERMSRLEERYPLLTPYIKNPFTSLIEQRTQ